VVVCTTQLMLEDLVFVTKLLVPEPLPACDMPRASDCMHSKWCTRSGSALLLPHHLLTAAVAERPKQHWLFARITAGHCSMLLTTVVGHAMCCIYTVCLTLTAP
jgi:hypothetical protein